MKTLIFILILSVCVFGQTDPCAATTNTETITISPPDTTDTINTGINNSDTTKTLIINVQAGTYTGANGVLINRSNVCLKGTGNPTLQRTVFNNEPNEPSVVKIINASNVTVKDLKLEGVISMDNCPVLPIGVSVLNFTNNPVSNFRILNNEIKTIGSTGCMGTFQARGIQVVSVSNLDPINDIIIDNNKLTDLNLGNSEALTIGGNVENFTISNNEIWNVNNIAIDIFGDSNFQAKKGSITGNNIHDLLPGNAAYPFVAGIYIDGGTGIDATDNITIMNNTVTRFGIGIAIGSENLNVVTQFIHVEENDVMDNIVYGIGIGKDPANQDSITKNVRVTRNIIKGNVTDPTLAMNGLYGQIHFGSLRDVSLEAIEVVKNQITASNITNKLVSLDGATSGPATTPDVTFQGNKFNITNLNTFYTSTIWNWGNAAGNMTNYEGQELFVYTNPQTIDFNLPPALVATGSHNQAFPRNCTDFMIPGC